MAGKNAIHFYGDFLSFCCFFHSFIKRDNHFSIGHYHIFDYDGQKSWKYTSLNLIANKYRFTFSAKSIFILIAYYLLSEHSLYIVLPTMVLSAIDGYIKYQSNRPYLSITKREEIANCWWISIVY